MRSRSSHISRSSIFSYFYEYYSKCVKSWTHSSSFTNPIKPNCYSVAKCLHKFLCEVSSAFTEALFAYHHEQCDTARHAVNMCVIVIRLPLSLCGTFYIIYFILIVRKVVLAFYWLSGCSTATTHCRDPIMKYIETRTWKQIVTLYGSILNAIGEILT